MPHELITLHLIEPGTHGGDSLFEVSLMLDERTREALRDGSPDDWRHAISRARDLIDEHTGERRTAF